MDIYLFSITDDPRVVNKNVPADPQGLHISATPTDVKDILNPSFLVNVTSPTQIKGHYNYAHIPDFERYYFITNLAISPSANIQIDLHVDVLKTYENSIPLIDGIIIRSSKASGEMVDKSLPINEYKKDLYVFPSPVPVVQFKSGVADPDVLLFTT